MPQNTGKEKKMISLRQNIRKRKRIGSVSREALSHALLRGSLTLEAALVLPLFLFAVATILSLFLLMQTQYVVGNSLAQAVSDTALMRNRTPKQVKTLTQAAFYKNLAVQKCPLSMIKGGAAGFSWKNTNVDNAYIDACVTYDIKLPLNFFGKGAMRVADECRVHRWTGRQKEGAGEGEGEWVFVTPTQSVYHGSRNCSHLKLSIKTVSTAAIKKGSASYAPCGHCAKGRKKGGVVYVTAQGGRYHCRIDCSGLKRTVYMVKKSQVKGKGPCSRCGGR